jgi:hypothetical protein
MRNGGAPASSRLLFADAKSSFSAAESSPEEDPAAEFEWGVGCLLWMLLFRTSAAGGVVSAAQGPGFIANIANAIARILSIICGQRFDVGNSR